MKTKKLQSVKLEQHLTAKATSKGGAAFLDAVANRTRLWSDCRKYLPARHDPSQGYPTENVVTSLVHGLLTGGKGFQATEPMRGDKPLLDILGLDKAPSAATVEELVKYLADGAVDGLKSIHDVMVLQAVRGLNGESIRRLTTPGGFVPVFGDGSMLETNGKTKDCIKFHGDNKSGQMTEGVFVGPYQVISDFLRKGEDERGCLMRHENSLRTVLKRTKLMSRALFLQDAHYGDGPYLDFLETFKGSHYIVGAGKLRETDNTLSSQPETTWRDTTAATKGRDWTESAVCVCYIQCKDWPEKRVLIGRRWKREGDLFYRYAGVITNLSPDEKRFQKEMEKRESGFAETVWKLYDSKQGCENSWKDLLSDMGLHHPPSGKASANAVFFAIAALANNLSLICRRQALVGDNRHMALWRFRRDIIDVAATVACHAGRVTVRIMDARERIFAQLQAAFERIDALQCVL